jgi:general stress protein 26
MSELEERERALVRGLVDSAARTIAGAPSCWIATADENGVSRLRPMGRLPPEPGDESFRLRFLTDGRSGKAADIRRAGRVAFVFQSAEEAFVGLSGAARLEEDRTEVRRRWKLGYDPFFPADEDKANAVFLTVDADRLDLWIKGVTPEPFGLKTTTLERNGEGQWRLTLDGA